MTLTAADEETDKFHYMTGLWSTMGPFLVVKWREMPFSEFHNVSKKL